MPHSNAGFFKRFLATLIDFLIIILFLTIPIFVLFTFYPFEQLIIQSINYLTLYIILMFLLWIVNYLYEAFFIARYGGTIGKQLMGLKVVDKNSGLYVDARTALWRQVAGYAFSAQFFGLGFLRILKSPEKLAWHDDLFNTKVIAAKSHMLAIISLIVLPLLIIAVISLAIYFGIGKINLFLSPYFL